MRPTYSLSREGVSRHGRKASPRVTSSWQSAAFRAPVGRRPDWPAAGRRGPSGGFLRKAGTDQRSHVARTCPRPERDKTIRETRMRGGMRLPGWSARRGGDLRPPYDALIRSERAVATNGSPRRLPIPAGLQKGDFRPVTFVSRSRHVLQTREGGGPGTCRPSPRRRGRPRCAGESCRLEAWSWSRPLRGSSILCR